MNVKFYSLSTLPTAVAGAAGSFVNVTTGTDAGMYYCTGAGYLKLDNVAQDKAGEVKSASVETSTGITTFYNEGNTALFTLALADYITAEVAKLTGSATIASQADGVVTIKAGVSEANGKISNATGTDITLAKVATTGKADDILLDPSVQFGSEAETTVQDAIEALAKAFDGIVDNTEDAIEEALKTKLSGVENANADQYVKVSDMDTNQKQTLSVTVGSFSKPAVKDGEGNVTTEAVAQVKGLATVEDVEKVITDNEAVTTAALAELKAASHTHANKSELDKITDGDVEKWNAKQDAIAENTYDAYGAASTAKSEVIGTDADTKDSDTVKGAKAYAKDYADGLATNYDASGAAAAVQGNTTETVKSLADKLETINGEGEGSIKKAVADGIAEVVAGADSDFDTLKEVADWIKNDTTGAAALQAASHTHDNKSELDKITAGDVEKWNTAASAAGVSSLGGKTGALTLKAESTDKGDVNLSISETGEISAAIVADSFDEAGAADAVLGTAADTKDSNTVYGAKKYADSLVNDADGKSLYATAAQGAKADTAVQSVATGTTNGTIAVDGTDVTVKGLGSAAYTDTTAYDAAGAADAVLGKDTDNKDAATVYGAKAYAKDYADSLATNYDAYGAAADVKSEVIGTATDAAGADTINGAKAYADAAVADAALVWLTEFPTA